MVGGHSTTVLSSYWICLQTPARWLGMPTATLFNIRQAASMAGIAEGLLVWANITGEKASTSTQRAIETVNQCRILESLGQLLQ